MCIPYHVIVECTSMDDGFDMAEFENVARLLPRPAHRLVYLGGDGRGSDVGGRAVLCGRHTAVLLLLILFLALHSLVLRLPEWRAVGRR